MSKLLEFRRADSKSLQRAKPHISEGIICLSHLRWDFVYQRPQHLLSRFAKNRRVYFVEEPLFGADAQRLEICERGENLSVVVPHLQDGITGAAAELALRALIDDLVEEERIDNYVLWYYTPIALSFTRHLKPQAVIYDCMDELSGFKGAPILLKELESELFKKADIVFTGGQSLYEAKRKLHAKIYAFPSSVDTAHFAKARVINRTSEEEPDDQRAIPHPRLGFFGVIDERMDLQLLAGIAALRPNWHIVMIGPIVKIDPAEAPTGPNIHYLGKKSYRDLPYYLAGWDVALLPFALNESTRFISPTKTPEYLAAGKPVISTSIQDVIRPYGDQGLVRIADTPELFVAGVEQALVEDAQARQARSDIFLSGMSWDHTWAQMDGLIEHVLTLNRKGDDRGSERSLSFETITDAINLDRD